VLEACIPQMAKLATVGVGNRTVEGLQEREPSRHDARSDHPPILRRSHARNQPTTLQPVKEPGHIRVVRDEALPDVTAGEAVRFRAAEDAEHVVLRRRKAVGFQRGFGPLQQPIGCALQGDIRLFFGGRPRGCGLAFHDAQYSRDNDNCQYT